MFMSAGKCCSSDQGPRANRGTCGLNGLHLMCTPCSTVNYQGPRWLQAAALAVLSVCTALHASLVRLASKIRSIGVMVQLQLADVSGKHVPKCMHRPLLPLFHHNPRLAHAMSCSQRAAASGCSWQKRVGPINLLAELFAGRQVRHDEVGPIHNDDGGPAQRADDAVLQASVDGVCARLLAQRLHAPA